MQPSPLVVMVDAAPPDALPVRPEGIAPALTERPQWVLWTWGRTDKGKWTKLPTRPNGRLASTSDPSTWSPFETVLASYRRGGYPGLGYIFGDSDPFTGVDLDDVRDPGTGTLLDWAFEVVEQLQTYTDVSVTGTGVKLVARADLPGKRRRRNDHPGGGGVEMYQRRRFFALTGHTVGGQSDVRPRQDVINRLQEQLLENPPWVEKKAPPPPRPAPRTDQPLPGDEVLFERIRHSRHAAGFEALWRGDTSGYSTTDNEGHSEADLALCNFLRFYSGPAVRESDVDRLFRRSGLYRDKWDSKRGDGTYGTLTLRKAFEGGDYYTSDPGPPVVIGHAGANGRPTQEPDVPASEWAVSVDGRPALQTLPEHTTPAQRNQKKRTIEIYTGLGLRDAEFPQPQWVVPGLLSEGLNILAGKPKQGKSMMALNLALTIAAGGKALGEIQTTPGDVLYLSLEDKFRRVQSRARKMIAGLPAQVSGRFHVATHWPNQQTGGLELIRWWGSRVERPVLVIVDVWAKFRPAERVKGSAYGQDYDNLSDLKGVVDEMGCSSLVLMHCRKAGSDDALEEVSGTMGLTGVADGIVVLTRARNDNEAKIFTTGRDFQDEELAIRFDPETLTWRSLGKAEEHMAGKLQTAVLAYLRSLLGEKAFTPDIAAAVNEPPDNLRTVLHRLHQRGIIRRVGKAWAYPGDDPDATTGGEA